MNILTRIEQLQMERIELERQLAEPNSPADQAALEDELTNLTERINELCELYWNTLEDTRSCERCSGCANCAESSPGYDGADEI